MDGEAGKNTEEHESLKTRRSISMPDPPDDRRASDQQPEMTKKQEIELLIESICEDNLITMAALRDGLKTNEASTARSQIIESLMSEDFGLPQAKIAELIGVTYSAVFVAAKKIEKAKEEKKETPDEKIKTIEKLQDAAASETSKTKKETSNNYMILIKFEDHKDIHEKLIKRAADQFRTPECQILYMLKKEFEPMESEAKL